MTQDMSADVLSVYIVVDLSVYRYIHRCKRTGLMMGWNMGLEAGKGRKESLKQRGK